MTFKKSALLAGCFALLGLHSQGHAQSEPTRVSAKPKIVNEVGLFYKPNDVATGVREYKPGDLVLSQPTRWAVSAKIQEQVILGSGANAVVIARNSVLPLILVSNLPDAEGEQPVFCTVAGYHKTQNKTGALAALINNAANSLQDGQKCLWDKDGDGNAELGFLLNVGAREDRAPRPIPPVALNVEEFRAAGEGERVVIKLENGKRPKFSIDIIQQGKSIQFDTITALGRTYSRVTSLHKDSQYPTEMDIFGANVRILSYDKTSRLAKIELGLIEREKLVVVPTLTVIEVRY